MHRTIADAKKKSEKHDALRLRVKELAEGHSGSWLIREGHAGKTPPTKLHATKQASSTKGLKVWTVAKKKGTGLWSSSSKKKGSKVWTVAKKKGSKKFKMGA